MTENIVQITCKFIGDFEVANNIVRNGDALCRLSATNEKEVFNKLIVIQAGSLVEVALAQLVYRAQNYNREGVVNIPEADRAHIAKEEVAQFYSLIQILEKYKVLDKFGKGIYDELHKLRKYRNKIHIQEKVKIDGVSVDESKAFSADIVKWSLEFCSRIMSQLNEYFPRPSDLDQYARTVSIPKA